MGHQILPGVCRVPRQPNNQYSMWEQGRGSSQASALKLPPSWFFHHAEHRLAYLSQVNNALSSSTEASQANSISSLCFSI